MRGILGLNQCAVSLNFATATLSIKTHLSVKLPRPLQYTSNDWITLAKSHGIRLSMAGKGRCYDNINMERFWRSLKQEEVYLTDYVTLKDARKGISQYIEQYNTRRLHQHLGYKTPEEVFKEGSIWKKGEKTREPNVLLCVK